MTNSNDEQHSNSITAFLAKHGGAILLHENPKNKFVDTTRRLLIIIRHLVMQALDTLYSAFNPEKNILSIRPLEVHYAKLNKFNHPLENFLSVWDQPGLPSTYCALSIMDSFSKVKPVHNKSYVSFLMRNSLTSLYDKNTDSFIDFRSRKADFRSTYYAVRSIRLLSEILELDAEHIMQDLEINAAKFCKTIERQLSEYENVPWKTISPNFSIFEKHAYILDFLDKPYLNKSSIEITNLAKRYMIFSKPGQIKGFKLHLDDSSPSISANKSGVLLSTFLNKEDRDYFDIDFDQIVGQIFSELISKNNSGLHSELFNIYNTIIILDNIDNRADISIRDESKIDEIYQYIDKRIPVLSRELFYKGGYLFNKNFFAAPNLYATRLFIEILGRRNELALVDQQGLESFLLDCYDSESCLFRSYPYFSWYYSRNLN